MVSRICGTPQDKYLQVCELIATTAAPDKALTSLFALGWTQHSVGSQNIRTMAMVQLLLGNIGVLGRRHECAARPFQHPGPDRCRPAVEPDARLSHSAEGRARRRFEDYMKTRQYKPLRPGQIELLAELPEVLRQLPEGDLRRRGARRQRLGL